MGFLHTAEVHVETFDGLVQYTAPDVDVIHLVAPDLLAHAQATTPDDQMVIEEVRSSLRTLEQQEPDVIVCTCSTISGTAELLATEFEADMVRVDRPLARHIVTTAAKAALVAAVESTLAPTLELFEDEREQRAGDTELELVHCDHAWDHFVAGDDEAYYDAIARVVDGLDSTYDAVVLVQASMAGAQALVARPERVHTSPLHAVEAALELL